MVNNGLPMKFGAFVPPQNVVGLNPTLAIRRAIELAVHLDQIGFDEIWFGEHHSGAAEIVASPELIIAAAAERTKNIKFGTGVISLPYHSPFQVAERIVQLSHMTQGRVMFGAGPGQLATDAKMFGLEAAGLRPRLEKGLDIVLRLLAGEHVTVDEDWIQLHDAVLQLRPYGGKVDTSVVGTISPSGPKLAGRNGLGLLSLAATDPAGNDQLPIHWDIVQEEAKATGHTIGRERWRLSGPMHIAETFEKAVETAEYGLLWQYEYLSHISPSSLDVPGTTREMADVLNSSGRGVIGTPQMAVDQINRLIERSGGFGTYMVQGIDFANWSDTLRSYELIAEQVLPHFTGVLDPVLDSYNFVLGQTDANRSETQAARDQAKAQYEAERAASGGSK